MLGAGGSKIKTKLSPPFGLAKLYLGLSLAIFLTRKFDFRYSIVIELCIEHLAKIFSTKRGNDTPLDGSPSPIHS